MNGYLHYISLFTSVGLLYVSITIIIILLYYFTCSSLFCSNDILTCLIAVIYAYEQCLQTMGFHPNVWCEAALYLDQVSQKMMDKGVS